MNFPNTEANILQWTLIQSIHQAFVSLAGGGSWEFHDVNVDIVAFGSSLSVYWNIFVNKYLAKWYSD